jgi:hypothetical protein
MHALGYDSSSGSTDIRSSVSIKWKNTSSKNLSMIVASGVPAERLRYFSLFRIASMISFGNPNLKNSFNIFYLPLDKFSMSILCFLCMHVDFLPFGTNKGDYDKSNKIDN